jgi:hypothetical protein
MCFEMGFEIPGSRKRFPADVALPVFQSRLRPLASGKFHDQEDAKWIVIRGQLWGHNDMPIRPSGGQLPAGLSAARGLAALRAYFVVSVSPRKSHADPLFAKLCTIKIEDLFDQRVRLFSYKSYHNQLPSEMNALLGKVSDSHSHNTRGARRNLFVNHSIVKSIKYNAPKLWNALDEKLKVSGAVSSFKPKSREEFLLGYSKFKCNIKGCDSCKLL